MEQFQEIKKVLPMRFRKVFEELDCLGIQELRFRIGKSVHAVTGQGEQIFRKGDREFFVNEEDIREMSQYISGYSMYAFEEELRNGFVTLRGGHRIGIAGEVVLEDGKIKTMKHISSFNVRFCREVKGCADELMQSVKGNVLIFSPPGAGKTTLLRDMLRQFSNCPGENVAVVDERSEIAACFRGKPGTDLGERTDVLDNCPKAVGMLMLLRSMSPTIIGVDELGQREDLEAVLRVVNCGVRLIATAHGQSLEELKKKEVFAEIFKNHIFQTYIQVRCERGKKIYDIYHADASCRQTESRCS